VFSRNFSSKNNFDEKKAADRLCGPDISTAQKELLISTKITTIDRGQAYLSKRSRP